jgi:hypothetical protein
VRCGNGCRTGDVVTIHLTMKNGTRRTFEDRGAPGGSYAQSMRAEIGFVVITDAYGKSTWIPSEEIAEIEQESIRRGW